jgi:hypothetical protein
MVAKGGVLAMQQITLTPEQASVVRGATSTVEVLDQDGRIVTHLTRLGPEDLEAIKRFRRTQGKNGQGVPAAQVHTRLKRLEEIRQSEGMDEAKMLDLVRRMRQGETV